MGKKHKKHRSDKQEPEEFSERPLKLVLKVSGNEVTTGSSSRDTFYDEQSQDYDKPKDKKKKKKKDKDKSFGSPESDKGKKKMTKKRKVQDTEDEDREQCRTPIRTELDKLEAEKEQTPLQEALNQLIRQLQRKDPSAFFTFPVTDLIAPGYSLIIKRPMDFSAIKDKVKKEIYRSLDELKADFRLMCENAMTYNKPETIYHRAARNLLHSGMKILSQERLQSLKQSIQFMSGLDPSAKDLGGSSHGLKRERMTTTDGGESSQAGTPRQDKDSKDEAAKAEKELQEIRKVIEESGGKLSNRVLHCDLEFMRQKNDGSTTLAVLNPADPTSGDVGYCPVKLGMMNNRLQNGINALQGFREDKRNRVTPVTYMNYGPYTSYAPAYDSSFSNVSKDDSDLIYSLYGEESSLQGSDSLSEFLAKSDEYVYKMADNFLDAMTNGEHLKSLKGAEPTPVAEPEPVPEPPEDKDEPEATEAEKSDSEQAEEQKSPEEEDEGVVDIQQKLDETTKLLSDLQEVQRERLSAKQPPNMICLLAPTTKEMNLAEKVTKNLTRLTGQVAPCDVSSVQAIRRAMGISVPAEPLLDLTTVLDNTDHMDTSSLGPDAPVVVM